MFNYDLSNTAALVNSGIIQGIPIDEYHKSTATSKSQLDQFAKSPAHYLASLTTPREETDAMKIGSLFHTMVLEPEKQNFVVGPDVNKSTNVWKAFKAEAEANNQLVIDQKTLDMLNGMAASVRAHPAASALLSGPGIAEGSAYWIDERSGELCRCRPDFYRQDLGIIVDLKTTEDASREAFARSIWKYGYHRQSAMYLDGVEASTGDIIKGFVFVCVEKSAPYCTAVYRLNVQGEDAGRESYKTLLLDLAECKQAKNFPGYSTKIETIELPRYAIKELGHDYE